MKIKSALFLLRIQIFSVFLKKYYNKKDVLFENELDVFLKEVKMIKNEIDFLF